MSSTALPQSSRRSKRKKLEQRSLLGRCHPAFCAEQDGDGRALLSGGLAVLIAIFGRFDCALPYDDADCFEALQPPSAEHWMGTDQVGRDVYLANCLRFAHFADVGLGVQLIALVIGVPLGLAAGMLGGKVDLLIMRLVEIFTAIPALMLALL